MKNKKFPFEKPDVEVITFSTEILTTQSGKDREVAELEDIDD